MAADGVSRVQDEGDGRNAEVQARKVNENVEAADDDDDEDEEDDDDEDDECGDDMVGYLEKPPSARERKLLTRRNFPSKVGGKPAWLIPQALPDTSCRRCSRPMRFLMQAYASRGEHKPEAFHRVLHVFVCTQCQPNEVCVFRAQLPRANDFYSSDAPEEEQVIAKAFNDPELELVTCWDCGLPVTSKCSAEADAGGVENRCVECARRLRNGDGPAMFEERELTTCGAIIPDGEDEEEDEPEEAQPSAVPSGAAADGGEPMDLAPEGRTTGAMAGVEVSAHLCGKQSPRVALLIRWAPALVLWPQENGLRAASLLALRRCTRFRIPGAAAADRVVACLASCEPPRLWHNLYLRLQRKLRSRRVAIPRGVCLRATRAGRRVAPERLAALRGCGP